MSFRKHTFGVVEVQIALAVVALGVAGCRQSAGPVGPGQSVEGGEGVASQSAGYQADPGDVRKSAGQRPVIPTGPAWILAFGKVAKLVKKTPETIVAAIGAPTRVDKRVPDLYSKDSTVEYFYESFPGLPGHLDIFFDHDQFRWLRASGSVPPGNRFDTLWPALGGSSKGPDSFVFLRPEVDAYWMANDQPPGPTATQLFTAVLLETVAPNTIISTQCMSAQPVATAKRTFDPKSSTFTLSDYSPNALFNWRIAPQQADRLSVNIDPLVLQPIGRYIPVVMKLR